MTIINNNTERADKDCFMFEKYDRSSRFSRGHLRNVKICTRKEPQRLRRGWGVKDRFLCQIQFETHIFNMSKVFVNLTPLYSRHLVYPSLQIT